MLMKASYRLSLGRELPNAIDSRHIRLVASTQHEDRCWMMKLQFIIIADAAFMTCSFDGSSHCVVVSTNTNPVLGMLSKVLHTACKRSKLARATSVNDCMQFFDEGNRRCLPIEPSCAALWSSRALWNRSSHCRCLDAD